MNQLNKYGLLAFFAILLGSCSKEKLSINNYIKWVENSDNGLLIAKEINGFKFNLQYKPIEYVIVKENRNSAKTLEEFNNQKEELKDFQYFTFRIGTVNNISPFKYKVNSSDESKDRLNYLSFYIKDDISLVYGKDTIPCVLCDFERSYDMLTSLTFVLAFDISLLKTKYPNDMTFVYDDNVFDSGIIKMHVFKSDLENIPTLKLL